jgi:hypothetical protein
MRRSIRLACVVLVGACSSAPTPTSLTDPGAASANATLALPLAGTYVLSALGTQTAAPFETLNLRCGDGRHIQGYIYGDTLALAPDGSVRRSFAIGQVYDGNANVPSYDSLIGTWREIDGTRWSYFTGAPTIGVELAPAGGVSPYRVESATRFSTPYAMGGSCVGQPTTGQTVIAVYSRI